jgi:hypothetical protein
MGEFIDLQETRRRREAEALIEQAQKGYGVPTIDSSMLDAIKVIHYLAPDDVYEGLNLNFLICDMTGGKPRAIGLLRLTRAQWDGISVGGEDMKKALEKAYASPDAKAASEP